MPEGKKKQIRRRRILRIPFEYLDAIPIGSSVFPTLFQFENGLRLATYKHLSVCYGENWWEEKLKQDLPKIYQYVEDQKAKKSYMPWIGDSSKATLLPIHSITLGQLEQIIIYYKSECITELFPSIEFFMGHMEIIKRVRNLFSHMYPCLTRHDIVVAKREIKTLCEHIEKKI